MTEENTVYGNFDISQPENIAAANTYTNSPDEIEIALTGSGSAGVGDGKAWYSGINDFWKGAQETVNWGLKVNKELAGSAVQVIKAQDQTKTAIETAKTATRIVNADTPNAPAVIRQGFDVRQLITPALMLLAGALVFRAVKK